jgi:glutamine amidotransferase
MCRVAFSAGTDELPLAAVLYDPPHALSDQAWQPREQHDGHVNVDGTGIAWWTGEDPAPLRYVTTATPWADANLPALAPRLDGHTLLAAVRGATPGIGFGTDLVAPFVRNGLAFTHNGWIGGFRDHVASTLLRALPDDLLGADAAVSDSTVVFHTVLARHRRHGDLVRAVADALGDVAAACRSAGQRATLNVVVTDGAEAVATRSSCGLAGNSLYVRARPSGRVDIASEPLDDHGWDPVPDDSLLHVRDATVTDTRLKLEP